MSLYGALFGGVSGLKSQSSSIGIISDNISNVNTIGYKQATGTFQTLVVNSTANSGSYQTGGVRGGTVLNVNKQGLLQSTESPTDLAISGNGFFVVKASSDTSVTSAPLYTRAGSFTQDSVGNFKNPQGYFLQGWPLDREGRLPGAVGNLNTTAFTNFDSLKTVNVQSASGVAQATSLVTFGANLKASEVVYPGETKTVTLDTNNVSNRLQPADGIIADGEYGMQGGVNGVNRGDQFGITTGNGLQYSYEYGGFTIGRDISASGSSANYGDGALDNSSPLKLAAGDVTFVSNGTSSSTYNITVPSHDLITGDTITLSNIAGFNASVNSALTALALPITRIDANTIQVTVSALKTSGTANTGTTTTVQTRQFKGNVLDATSPAQTFLNKIGSAGFTDSALTFSISTATSGTVNFTYTTTTPNTSNGEFNNLSTLATAINNVSGLTARVVDNKRLVIGGADATEGVTFANGDATGTSTKRGIDWISELDLKDVPSGTRRYSTLDGLAKIITADDGVSAQINNALSTATLDVRVDDPLDTITFNDLPPASAIPTTAGGITTSSATYTAGTPISITIADTASTLVAGDSVYVSGLGATGLTFPGAAPNGGPYTVTSVTAGVGYTFQITPTQSGTLTGTTFTANSGGLVSLAGKANHGSMLGQLGLTSSLNGTLPYTGAARTTGALGPQYDPTGVVGKNMASGDITAQFSRNVRVYDGLGTGHDIRFSYIKIAQNRWRVEVHAIPATDIVTRAPLVNGQIAVGELDFNGDGTLRSISPTLPTIPNLSGSSATVPVGWVNGSVPSNLSFNFGTAGLPFGTAGATSIGLSDGLSQFDSAYNVNFANQNGAPVGELQGVAIDSKGIVIASYSNGQTQSLFQLPLAQFANPNGTQAISGNVYSQTRDSGEVNLREAGTNGTGAVVASTLEQSNVDLAQQLTDLIVAQRSYQANTQVIKTTSELLQQLNQITG